MNSDLPASLEQFAVACEEAYRLALEENRFLKEQRRAPDAALLDRKRALLGLLDEALPGLKTTTATRHAKEQIEALRARILQILHLDRENEQLLLRYSLAASRPTAASTPLPPPPVAAAGHLYRRTAG